MYAKINWEDQTVVFVSDESAEKFLHSPTAVYYINENWLPDAYYLPYFETADEAIAYLMDNYFDSVAEWAEEDDWFYEQHPDWDIDEGANDLALHHLDWLYDFLVHYADDIVKPSYANCNYEFIKVPETAS